MDQNTVVTEQLDAGERLIQELRNSGLASTAAFWAKPNEEVRWFLYLASPVVDSQGLAAAYRAVHDAIRRLHSPWIDPFDVRVISPGDPMARHAEALTRPVAASGPFAVPNPKPYPGRTRFGGDTLGGVSVDGAIIYPPSAQPVA
jgi:hypothetical protein